MKKEVEMFVKSILGLVSIFGLSSVSYAEKYVCPYDLAGNSEKFTVGEGDYSYPLNKRVEVDDGNFILQSQIQSGKTISEEREEQWVWTAIVNKSTKRFQYTISGWDSSSKFYSATLEGICVVVD